MAIILSLLENHSCVFIPHDQMLAASARISSVMGSSYAKYLPSVLPHLLQVILEEANVSVTVCVRLSSDIICIFHALTDLPWSGWK